KQRGPAAQGGEELRLRWGSEEGSRPGPGHRAGESGYEEQRGRSGSGGAGTIVEQGRIEHAPEWQEHEDCCRRGERSAPRRRRGCGWGADALGKGAAQGSSREREAKAAEKQPEGVVCPAGGTAEPALVGDRGCPGIVERHRIRFLRGDSRKTPRRTAIPERAQAAVRDARVEAALRDRAQDP